MSNNAIEIRNLSHEYPGGKRALDAISLLVHESETTAILGANGAGKSTLLLHLNGCLMPQSGEVFINGLKLERQNLPAIRAGVGLVFQNPDDQLFMPSVIEDVAFGPLNMGVPPDAAERLALDCLERFEIAHLAKRPPYRLSAGEKRTVSIATAMVSNPGILAMDEPSSHLDPRSRRRLISLLKSLKQTLIMATHDLELAALTCRQALLLGQGQVVAQGPTRDLLENEQLMLEHGLEQLRLNPSTTQT